MLESQPEQSYVTVKFFLYALYQPTTAPSCKGQLRGYRIPIPRPTSAYHENCIPAAERAKHAQHASQDPRRGEARSAGPDGRKLTQRDYVECNSVTGDKIWRESVTREKNALTKWEQQCGFMKDFDQHGNLKKRPDTPSNLSVYSDDVPNTSNQKFGHRQRIGSARAMVSLQHRFSTSHRRRRNKELICYD